MLPVIPETKRKEKEKNTEDPAGETWILRLYVAGQTPNSLTAFENLKKICETHLRGEYKIEIVDLLENPQLAEGDQIRAPGAQPRGAILR